MEYTTTDCGRYEEITLTAYGEATSFVAAEFVTGEYINIYILEPEDRKSWDPQTEENFRRDVRQLIEDFEEKPDYLVFDPARDNQSEEML